MKLFDTHSRRTSFHFLLIHLLLSLICITEFPLSSQGCHEEERKALLSFKSALEDPADRLSSWKQGNKNCCDWHGIQCSSVSLYVIKIDLRNKDTENYYTTALRGKISPSLFKITHLEYLDLSCNAFYRDYEIPFEFANLRKLIHLDLSKSAISGRITTQFTNLSSLQYLDLSCRHQSCLSLSSMKWLRQLVNLKVLRLRRTDLSEATSYFGEHMSYLSNLRVLDLSGCYINNTAFLTNMFEHQWPKLQNLWIDETRVEGSIPMTISNAPQLVRLSASDCSIQGSLPSSIYNLSQLQFLDLSSNSITCHIHSSISNLRNLYSLDLSSNNFQGSLPSSIYNLSQLQFLDLSRNSITCHIHSSISNLRNLYSLDLSSNNFQGSIPKSICEIYTLQQLSLNHNNISGRIPSCITKLRHLRFFDVFNNSMEGAVPLISWINGLNLTRLELGSNKLTVRIDQRYPLSPFTQQRLALLLCDMKRSIPTFIFNSTHTEYLDLGDTDLYGDSNPCMCKLENVGLFHPKNYGLVCRPQPPPSQPPSQHIFAKENVLFYGVVALGFIVGFWGLFFGLLIKREKWWCKYWRFVDTVAKKIVAE